MFAPDCSARIDLCDEIPTTYAAQGLRLTLLRLPSGPAFNWPRVPATGASQAFARAVCALVERSRLKLTAGRLLEDYLAGEDICLVSVFIAPV
jgi:hypothetical protein